MATPELTGGHQAGTRRLPGGGTEAWLCAYGALWALTLATAGLLAVAGPTLQAPTRRLLALTLTPSGNPPPNGWRVLALAAHNIPIAAWPLLLGLAGMQRSRRARTATDALVLACMLANTIPAGAALGAYGSALIPYVPQLPLEWAGLAAGYASWLIQRKQAIGLSQRLRWLAVVCVPLISAAVIETTGVPHR
jgi:hypothetical protein